MSRPSALSTPVPGAFTLAGFPLVDIDRGSLDTYLRRGFALASSKSFTLLHTIGDQSYALNGYAIIRHNDIRSWEPVPPSDFLARAARLQRLKPRLPGPIRLSSWAAALTDAGALFPLLTLYRETSDQGACFIGRLVKAAGRSVTIESLSPDAEWEGLEQYPLDELTLVEFGSAYEKLLNRLAPAP